MIIKEYFSELIAGSGAYPAPITVNLVRGLAAIRREAFSFTRFYSH